MLILRLSLAALVLVVAQSAYSQAAFPSPVLTSITPLGGKPGSTVELSLRGADLDAPQAVLIGGRQIPITASTKASLVLPADLPAGIHDLRFVGRYGVSNPRVFQVSPHETIISTGAVEKCLQPGGKQTKQLIRSAIAVATTASPNTPPHSATERLLVTSIEPRS